MVKNSVEKKKYTKEQLKAAYALNLCTVSISQIIDYNDVMVMEQEYETILNNLNLEHMPKDEALLKILKQLLDTITFFRIQEGDRKIAEKDYQYRIKNAIWSAVPNIGLIVAGGSLTTTVISLASQVGIGYMNYRRNKADIHMDAEKKHWELERTAIEQIHGLQRELFDTAWRLASAYNFPDELRLTERQIKQYNAILMDPDEIRKYERLDTIKGDFVAYPPFWYNIGSVANRIYQNESLSLETRMQYRYEALEAFRNYWKSNEFPLLREDYLASSCALEHIELLDPDQDHDAILQLLERAEQHSGRANDILQLCAVGYLRIGEKGKAIDLFRILVNEEYNLEINAQMLSALYVNEAFSEDNRIAMEARARYEILASRVNSEYILRMPSVISIESKNVVEDEFMEHQESLLQRRYWAVVEYCIERFIIRLGKLIPGSIADQTYPDSYFSEGKKEQRLKDLDGLFNTSFLSKQKQEYLERLSRTSFVTGYFDEINKFFDEVMELNCLRDRNKLKEIISDKLKEEASLINSLSKKINEQDINYKDIIDLVRLTSYEMFKEFFTEIKEQIRITILGMNRMEKFAEADIALRKFCNEHELPEPDLLMEESGNANPDTKIVPTYFGFELLGEPGCIYQKEQVLYKAVEKVIKKHVAGNPSFYLHNSAEFNRYIEQNNLQKNKDILSDAIAIYDDKSKTNADIIFASNYIVPLIRKKVKQNIPYESIASDDAVNRAESMRKDKYGTFAPPILRISPLFWSEYKMKEYQDTVYMFGIIQENQAMIDEILIEKYRMSLNA